MKKIFLSVAVANSLFLGSLEASVPTTGTQSVKEQKFQIGEIKLQNLTYFGEMYIIDKLNIKINKSYTQIDLKEKIKSLLSLKVFKNIDIELKNKTLVVKFVEFPKIVHTDLILPENIDLNTEEKVEILKLIKLNKSDVFIEKEKDKYIKNLQSIFLSKGFKDITINIKKEKISDKTVKLDLNVSEGKGLVVKKVSFKGQTEDIFTAEELEDLTQNHSEESFSWLWGRSEGNFNPGELQYDVMRVKQGYMSKGFLDAKVSFPKIKEVNGNVEIIYEVNEGNEYKLNNVAFQGLNNIISEEDLKEELTSKIGNTVNNIKILKDSKKIETKISNLGYAFVKIEQKVKKIGVDKLDLVYVVSLGERVLINDILIKGNSKTLDNVIRRMVFLTPDSYYTHLDYIDSLNALKRSGLFGSVKLKKERISQNKMNLVVEVTETKTGNISVGGGYGTYEGFIFDSSVTERNFLGTGYQLSTHISKSEKELNYSLGFLNPGIFDSKYSFNVGLENSNSEADYDTYELDKKVQGYSFGLGFNWNRYTKVNATYRSNNVKDEYNNFIGTDKTDSYTTNTLTPTISFDNTDDYLLPRKGFKFLTSLEWAGFGGDSEYLKSTTQLKFFKSLEDITNHDIIFRNKSQLKILVNNGKTTVADSFHMGGQNSVRGYQSYAFGPSNIDDDTLNRVFTNSTEISFPLSEAMNLRGFTFLDFGMIGKDDFNRYTKVGTGLGLEWFSPIGPIQLVYAHAINPDVDDKTSNFEIQIGTTF